MSQWALGNRNKSTPKKVSVITFELGTALPHTEAMAFT
jgi:hypothetical protein